MACLDPQLLGDAANPLFLDVETLSVPRVTPFSGCNPVHGMMLPLWRPRIVLVGRVAPAPHGWPAATLYDARAGLIPSSQISPPGWPKTPSSAATRTRVLISICP